MKKINTRYRTIADEVMDDFELSGHELRNTLKDLDKINRWLGGNKITIDGLKEILERKKPQGKIKIVDTGCGSGNVLREIAIFGRKKGLSFELIGIDANPHAVKIAQEWSVDYPEISFLEMNLFSEDFETMEKDIILCTLTLHHFRDEQIRHLLKNFAGSVKIGVVINDLQRSATAYRLFQAFCTVFIDNEIARKDGLISILRGFRRKDLNSYAHDLKVKYQKVNWKWAFRYQWILVIN